MKPLGVIQGLNKANRFMYEGRALTAALQDGKDFFKHALVANALVEPMYYMDAQTKGYEYNLTNSLANIGIGTAVGTALFAPILGALRIRKTGRLAEHNQMFTEVNHFMQTGDIRGAANTLYESSPIFRDKIQKVKEVSTIIKI